jgi:hypothetical protein
LFKEILLLHDLLECPSPATPGSKSPTSLRKLSELVWIVSRMALFTKVEKSFEYLRTSQRLDPLVERWRDGCGELASVAEPAALIGRCGDAISGDDRGGDLSLSVLCRRAVGGGKHGTADEDAACVLLWLLLSPLKRRSRDPDVRGALDADDAQAEFAAGLWEEAVAVNAGDSGVARRLVNGGRRRTRAAARREIEYLLHRRRLRDISIDPVEPDAIVNPERVVAAAFRHCVLNPIEADLILSTRLGAETVADTSRRLGLTRKAAYHRRWRAEERHVAWMRGEQVPSRFRARSRHLSASFLARSGVSDPRGTTHYEVSPSKSIEGRWCRGHPSVWPTARPAGPMQLSRRMAREPHAAA